MEGISLTELGSVGFASLIGLSVLMAVLRLSTWLDKRRELLKLKAELRQQERADDDEHAERIASANEVLGGAVKALDAAVHMMREAATDALAMNSASRAELAELKAQVARLPHVEAELAQLKQANIDKDKRIEALERENRDKDVRIRLLEQAQAQLTSERDDARAAEKLARDLQLELEAQIKGLREEIHGQSPELAKNQPAKPPPKRPSSRTRKSEGAGL